MNINPDINSPQFTADYNNPAEIHRLVKDVTDRTKGISAAAKSLPDDAIDSCRTALNESNENINQALKAIKGKIKSKNPSKVYVWIMKGAESVGKLLSKGGGGGKNLATAVTSVILWGNVLKEVVGTALYTTQALTNEDLPKDKRRFVGAYDLGVGLTSTCISFILGVGFQDIIKNMYKRTLKGIKGVNPKYNAILEGLSAFTSFGLQTIVGKRILAPLVGVPVATGLRKWMEERDAKKNGVSTKQQQAPSNPIEYPTNRQGYVDIQAFAAQAKEHQTD